MSKLIPGRALIYERVDGVVYARYRDPPHNNKSRWIIGGDLEAVNRAQGRLFSYSDWQDMMRLADHNETLNKQLDKLVTTYYIIKDDR
jgi:uncharacterized protein (DUF302 family)